MYLVVKKQKNQLLIFIWETLTYKEVFMRSVISRISWLIAVFAVVAVVSSCFYATTKSTEGTTKSVKATSGSSTNATSSTSPGSSSDESEKQALEFTKDNFERLRTDMAVGGGEHLTSLATLMGIPDSRKPEFFSLTKNKFSTLFRSDQVTPEELLAMLDSEISADPYLKD